MVGGMINGVVVTPLSIIDTTGGDVMHGMKHSDKGYVGFGEAYFSIIEYGLIKGWKRHKEMVMNLVVPLGAVRFVLYDGRHDYTDYSKFQEITLSRDDNYCRLTVPTGVWMGFQGLSEIDSILLNIASIEHSLEEVDKKALDEINFDWSK
jgi:dTDP-4-dehydrorhamnose 3,5-epimerase